LKKIRSKYNGLLEVDIEDGRKVLNSENTSYSGQTLHDIFEKVFKKIDLNGVKSILLLGLGGGTVVDMLTEELHYKGKLTTVELDPVIVQIASREFGIRSNSKLEVICMDATEYVRSSRKKFDIIICDIFVDSTLPEVIVAPEFWNNVAKRLSEQGLIVFNVFHEIKKMTSVAKQLNEMGFDVKLMNRINGSNTFLFARKPVA
jgi:spermidine synthase